MKKTTLLLIIFIFSFIFSQAQMWNSLGPLTALGNASSGIKAIAVSPYDGNIYVGGTFTGSVNYLARYNSTTNTWLQIGSLNGPVYAMATYKGKLYIGGSFTSADGLTVKNIVSLSVTGAFNQVLDGLNGQVNCFNVPEDSSKLYIGGTFIASGGGGTTLSRIASLTTTTSWVPLGTGLSQGVNSITEYTAATVKSVYAGTDDLTSPVYKFSGISAWTALPSLTGGKVNALASINGYLYCGGEFNQPYFCGAKWDGTNWSSLITNLVPANKIYSFLKVNTRLYIGGAFTGIGVNSACNYIARIEGPSIPFQAVLTANSLAGAPQAICNWGGYLVAGGNWLANGMNISITSTTIGIDEISNYIESSTFFPNPMSSQATFSVKLKKHFNSSSFMIYNNQGQLVAEKFIDNISTNDLLFNIDRDNLKSGIYHFQLILDGHSVKSDSFIIE